MTARGALLRAAVGRLADAGVDGPEREARLLLRWASGLGAAELSVRLGEPPNEEERARFAAGVAARAARRPLSHVTGERLFWGRRFRVTPDVLDPRPETETLVEAALAQPFSEVLDLGTGSGCILISLLADRPEARGVGTDLSAPALAVARENAMRHGAAERIELRRVDWLRGPVGLAGRFDLVVSNPPYVAASEMPDLAPEVRDHEPHAALSPGGDGLGAYRAIAQGLGQVLAPGGRVLLELGPAQAAAVATILRAAGLAPGRPLRDLDGRERVLPAMAQENRVSRPFGG